MSICYPTSSLCSPIPSHTATPHPHPPLPPTYYYYYFFFFPPVNLLIKSIMHYSVLTFRTNPCLSGFDRSLPPLVYIEGQPSSHVDGALDVDLEVLVCSPHHD